MRFIIICSYKLCLSFWFLRNFLSIKFRLIRFFLWCWWLARRIICNFLIRLKNFSLYLLLFLYCLLDHLFLLFDFCLNLIYLIWSWSYLLFSLLPFRLYLDSRFSFYLLFLSDSPCLLLLTDYYFSIIVRNVCLFIYLLLILYKILIIGFLIHLWVLFCWNRGLNFFNEIIIFYENLFSNIIFFFF